MNRRIPILVLAFSAQAAVAQTCIDPERIMSSSAHETRETAAMEALQKDSALVEARHCAINVIFSDPVRPGEYVSSVSSRFVYEPYAISESEFFLDVVRCVGVPTQPLCELQTETHYFRGDLSFSVQLLDGIDASTADQIVDATMDYSCGPTLPQSTAAIEYLDRLQVGRRDQPDEYWIGTWGCQVHIKISEGEVELDGTQYRVQ